MRLPIVLSLTLLFAALSACRVEGPPIRSFVTNKDAGTADASGDAGTSCAEAGDGGFACPQGQVCNSKGACVERSTCTTTSECRVDQACISGLCKTDPLLCNAVDGCDDPRTVCTAAGYCALAFSSSVAAALSCGRGSDCGPAGLCVGDVCVKCGPLESCPRALTCDPSGFCVESFFCSGNGECFPGNSCMDGACTRSKLCTADTDNSAPEMATPLNEVLLHGVSICGNGDLDYYKLEIPSEQGAQIAVTSTRSVSFITARAIDMNGTDLEHTAQLVLPGLTLIDIPGDAATQVVYLEISSLDVTSEYRIDVRFHDLHCAGDALDLYGDSTRERAAFALSGAYVATACPADEDWIAVELESGEALQASISWDATTQASFSLQLWDAGGDAPLASSATTSSGSLEVAGARVFAKQRQFIRVITGGAPLYGADYLLTLSESSISRFAACDAAPTIDLSHGTGTATAGGSLRGARDLGAPVCGAFSVSASRGDRIYRVIPPEAPSVITADLRQLGGGATATIALAALDVCAEDLSATACSISPLPYRASQLSVERSTVDPVWLYVSSDAESENVDYELRVRADTPSVNDTCANAIDLPSSTTVNAATIGAHNDARVTVNGCAPAMSGGGFDRFYRLSLAAGERAVLELSGDENGFLWVATDCAMMTATCVGASVLGPSPGPPARVVLAPMNATEYFVAVDTNQGNSGGVYRLRVLRGGDVACVGDTDCVAPRLCDDFQCVLPPVGDTCPGEQLAFTNGVVRVDGSLGAAASNYELQCNTSRNQVDVVYRVDVPAGHSRMVARIVDAEFDPVVAIRTVASCAAFGDLTCNDDEIAEEELLSRTVLRNPPAGAYSILVDAFLGEGKFTLEVELD